MAEERARDGGLWQLADLETPMAIRVAATLRIADRIVGGDRTAAELAGATNTDVDALDRVLRHLAAAGVLQCDESGRYALTASGDALRDGHPAGLRAMLDIGSAIGRAELAFVHLLHSVRTGEAAFPRQYGRPFWDDLARDEERRASFDAQMGFDAARWAQAVVPSYDWGSLGHVVDVGGGDGTLLTAMLRTYPDLRGTVFERPATAATARQALAEAGLSGRCDAVGGSFFKPLPPGAGGYVLCAVLHDWDDEAARAILRQCAHAAAAGGAVFVVEKIGADGRTPRTAMDLRVLVYMGGRERGVAAIAALAADCDLRLICVHPAGDLAIVELRAAPP